LHSFFLSFFLSFFRSLSLKAQPLFHQMQLEAWVPAADSR
jgi:hypothetical protein